MSHVGDTSNQTTDEVTPGSTSRSGVASSCSEVGGFISKKLKFNENSLPIGKNSAKSSSRLGCLARTLIPICYNSWPDVDTKYKDQLWEVYKNEYPDVKESQREIFMKKACEAWKKYKSNLQGLWKVIILSNGRRKSQKNINSEDWEQFCDHEATPKQKDVRKWNKAIKISCERKSTHNTGRDGYARAVEKLQETIGHPPSRAELWLYIHHRKDGSYAPYDQQFEEKVEMLLKLFQQRGEEETLDTGPIYETFGKNTRGRVRCVGSTISRKALLASSFAREMLKEVDIDRNDWKAKVENLKEKMEGMESTLTQFINDLKSGKFVCGGHNIHISSSTTNTPTSVIAHSPSNAIPNLNDLTLCEIHTFKGEIVGYGRKARLGAVSSVHGHRWRPREVQVVLDVIKVLEQPVWGGQRGPCSTLEDVGIGVFIYWHDDFLPSRDNTEEQ